MTVFYMLALALLDQFLYAQEMSQMAYVSYGVGSIAAIATIITAQVGLLRENYWLIMPFFGTQVPNLLLILGVI